MTTAIICNGVLGGLAGLAGLGFLGCSGGEPASLCGAAAQNAQAAEIWMTASTNSPSVDVVIFCDGSALRTVGTPRALNSLNLMSRIYDAGAPEVMKVVADLDVVGDVSAIPVRGDCPKSLSFGTKTTVSALNRISGDLQCLDSPLPIQQALADDCGTLVWQP